MAQSFVFASHDIGASTENPIYRQIYVKGPDAAGQQLQGLVIQPRLAGPAGFQDSFVVRVHGFGKVFDGPGGANWTADVTIRRVDFGSWAGDLILDAMWIFG